MYVLVCLDVKAIIANLADYFVYDFSHRSALDCVRLDHTTRAAICKHTYIHTLR